MKDAQNDAPRQMAQVKEFLNAKVDCIIISPKDDSLTPAIAEAFDAGIPVIVLDRAVQGAEHQGTSVRGVGGGYAFMGQSMHM